MVKIKNINKTKVIAFAGSLRKDSFNKSLLYALKSLGAEHLEIEVFDIKDIPLYSGDLEKEGFPHAVDEFREKVKQSQALIIATPEYNYSVPGVLKNALDWLSRAPKGVLDEKPTAILGASDGRIGTARAQFYLKSILLDLNCFVMPKPDVFISFAQDKIDNQGRVTDLETIQHLEKFVNSFVQWIDWVD